MKIGQKKYLIPPLRMLWIPAGVEHELTFLTRTESKSLFFSPKSEDAASVRVHGNSKLLGVLLESSFERNMSEEIHTLIGSLILLLLKEARPITSELSMPTTEIFLRTSQSMILENKWQLEAEDFAEAAFLHKASFLRHFRRDVGINFRDWKCLIRMCVALDCLASGMSVKNTALRLQFSCESNFVESFKKIFGTTPGSFCAPK